MTEYNGTNPLLDALGDEHIIRDVTLLNNDPSKIIEPLTGIHLGYLQPITIRVIGNAAFEQIKNNIDQLNSLKGDVIELDFALVDEVLDPEE
ncbi:hypothetical protein GWP85_07245 [Acinetobacter beijerinckii]|uniref:hypothetical protein n=1 Tax=Acinetobacter beijerinckii TaxID=262668 RepID=UPI0023DDE433|nr:hypothetical protein [Acinetobacter beijerinckii]MDF2417310.1 hypothetical protein [Acinetobacter beijerinckii]